MVVMVMLMVVIVSAAALAVLVVVMVMLMVVIVTAAALLTVLMVVMVVALALLIIVMMVVMMMLGLLSQASKLCLQGVGTLHGLQKLGARQIIPGGGDDDGGGVMLAEEGDGGLGLGGGGGVGVGQNDTARVLHLIVEEFTEVLHVHLALARIHHGGEAIQHCPFGGGALHGADNVGELAHARGLNEDAVGCVLGQHLRQGLAEIAHEGAADAAGIHLVDLDARLGEEAAVDADLTELVLDEYQLLACVGLGDEFFDEGGLTGPQEARENVDFGHDGSLLYG